MTKAINDALSALHMLATTNASNMLEALEFIPKFKEQLKNSFNEDVANHFEILAINLLNNRI